VNSIYTVNARILQVLPASFNELRDTRVFGVDGSAVSGLCFQEGDSKLELRRTAGSGWYIVEPVKWKADEEQVRALLGDIVALRSLSFAQHPESDLGALGLRPPAYTLAVSVGGTNRPAGRAAEGVAAVASNGGVCEGVRLLVSAHVPSEGRLTAAIDEGSTIVELPVEDVRRIMIDPGRPLALYDRSVLSVDPVNVRRIVLHKGSEEQTVELGPGGAWIAPGAGTNGVINAAVGGILLLVSNLRASRIETLDTSQAADFGLDQPVAALTLGLSGEQGILKTIVLGSATGDGSVFGMIKGQDAIFVLDESTFFRLAGDIVSREPSPR
jgi:hypothetical protein